MGILQEKRVDAPNPPVKETKYGAVYVEAATESVAPSIEPDSVEQVTESTPDVIDKPVEAEKKPAKGRKSTKRQKKSL